MISQTIIFDYISAVSVAVKLLKKCAFEKNPTYFIENLLVCGFIKKNTAFLSSDNKHRKLLYTQSDKHVLD